MTRSHFLILLALFIAGVVCILAWQQHRAGKKVAPAMHGSVQRALPHAPDLSREGKP